MMRHYDGDACRQYHDIPQVLGKGPEETQCEAQVPPHITPTRGVLVIILIHALSNEAQYLKLAVGVCL